MATRIAARYLSRRLSSSGKVLSEENAAENVCIKKMEQEKLDKLAAKGPKPSETPEGSVGDANPCGGASSLHTTRMYVCGVLALTGIAAESVWNISCLPFFGAALGADTILKSKNKAAETAFVFLGYTGPFAAAGYYAMYLDLKKKPEEVQE